MGISSKDFSEMVFQQSIQGSRGKLDMDGKMLRVLVLLDGRKNLDQVAKQCGLSLVAIRPIIKMLLKHKLIEHFEPTVVAADNEFFDYLVAQLSMAIGPLGEIILEDGLEDIGYKRSTLPIRKAAELITLLSEEIFRENKRIQFKETMLMRIRNFR